MKTIYIEDKVGLAWPVGHVGEKADTVKVEIEEDKVEITPIKNGIGAGNHKRELSFEEIVKRVYLYERYKAEVKELKNKVSRLEGQINRYKKEVDEAWERGNKYYNEMKDEYKKRTELEKKIKYLTLIIRALIGISYGKSPTQVNTEAIELEASKIETGKNEYIVLNWTEPPEYGCGCPLSVAEECDKEDDEVEDCEYLVPMHGCLRHHIAYFDTETLDKVLELVDEVTCYNWGGNPPKAAGRYIIGDPPDDLKGIVIKFLSEKEELCD